jgi:hypothetical protein
MASLPRLLEYDDQKHFGAFPNDSDMVGIVAMAKKYLNQGESLRARIRNVSKARYEEVSRLPAFIQQQMAC